MAHETHRTKRDVGAKFRANLQFHEIYGPFHYDNHPEFQVEPANMDEILPNLAESHDSDSQFELSQQSFRCFQKRSCVARLPGIDKKTVEAFDAVKVRREGPPMDWESMDSLTGGLLKYPHPEFLDSSDKRCLKKKVIRDLIPHSKLYKNRDNFAANFFLEANGL